MVQLRSWMIPAEACPGTFVTLKGACGKTTTTTIVHATLVTCQVIFLSMFSFQNQYQPTLIISKQNIIIM